MIELGFLGNLCVVCIACFILTSVLILRENQSTISSFSPFSCHWFYRLLSCPSSGILFWGWKTLVCLSVSCKKNCATHLIFCIFLPESLLFSRLRWGPNMVHHIQDVCHHVFIYNKGIMMPYTLFSLSFLINPTWNVLLPFLLISKLPFFICHYLTSYTYIK